MPKQMQEKLVVAAAKNRLQQEMSESGIKRGAPKGLLTVRLVFDPRRKPDKTIWEQLKEKADANGLEITDYVKNLVIKHIQKQADS